jgi:hypothetical protein
VHGLWLEDIESLEAISQDDETREVCLRMASLSQHGRLKPFLREVERDDALDAETKASLTELASDAAFLNAVAAYVHCTRELH